MKPGTVLLAVGALAGVALALWGLARSPASSARLPPGAVALVNGRPVWRADLDRALAALASVRRDGRADAELARRALDRLIDDELLVQRGVELGLAERDPRVRADLGAAVIDLVTARAESEAAEPGEDELRRFYAENAAYFRGPPRMRVEQIFFLSEATARAARARLDRGEPFSVLRAIGDPPPAQLPRAALPARELEAYLGTRVVAALAAVPIGAVAGPVPSRFGHHLVRVLERQAGELAPFESMRGAVVAEWRRRRGERALRRFLEERRRAARITFAPDAW